MKKILVLAIMLLSCFAFVSVQAEEVTTKSGMDWEISMMPKESAEDKEAARWSVVTENNIGVYAYDMSSLTYNKVKNGEVDKNMVSVLTKTVFTDKETLKKLNVKFEDKLAKKEKVQYCEIMMTFDILNGTYGVEWMDIYGSKKTLLQHTEKELNLVTVPVGSFAEAMLEICQKAAAGGSTEQGEVK